MIRIIRHFCFAFFIASCSKDASISIEKMEREDIDAVVNRYFDQNKRYMVKVVGPKTLPSQSDDIRMMNRKITDFAEYFLIGLGYDVLTSDPLDNISFDDEDEDKSSRKHHIVLRFGPLEYDDKKEIIFYFNHQKPIVVRGEKQLEEVAEKMKNLEMEIGSDFCLFQVPSKRISLKVEVLSTKNQKIIGKAQIVSTSKSLFPKNYKASILLGLKECQTLNESFDIDPFYNDKTLYDDVKSQVYQIITKIFTKLKQNKLKYEDTKETKKNHEEAEAYPTNKLPSEPLSAIKSKKDEPKEEVLIKEKEESSNQSEEEKKLFDLLKQWQKEK